MGAAATAAVVAAVATAESAAWEDAAVERS